MNSAFFAVQDALYEGLRADSGVQALLGNPARLYDHVPPDATFPFVTLGAMQAEGFDTSQHNGNSLRATLHIWSRARGNKEVKQIMDALTNRLHGGALSIAGQQLVMCRMLSAVTELDDDGLTQHGLLQFQIITQGA